MKLLLAVDLDDTHFKRHKSDIEWIGSKRFWLQLYQSLFKRAALNGVEVVFAVVTCKSAMDDLCIEAARVFKPFITQSNPTMYVGKNCLVHLRGELVFEALTSPYQTTRAMLDGPLSNFYVIANNCKATAIRQLAAHYDIPLKHCVLLDDTPHILLEATYNGIRTVSAEGFYTDRGTTNLARLDDEPYIQHELEKIREGLISHVEEICCRLRVEAGLEPAFVPGDQVDAALEEMVEEYYETPTAKPSAKQNPFCSITKGLSVVMFGAGLWAAYQIAQANEADAGPCLPMLPH